MRWPCLFIILLAGVLISSYIAQRIAYRYLRIHFDRNIITIEKLARDKKTVYDFESHHISHIVRFSDFNYGSHTTFKIKFDDKEDFAIHGAASKKTSGDLSQLIRDFKAFLNDYNDGENLIKYYAFYKSIWSQALLLIAIGLLLAGAGFALDIILNRSGFNLNQLVLMLPAAMYLTQYIWGYFEHTRNG